MWHLLLLEQPYTVRILIFHEKIHFEVGHRLYLHNQLEASKKALYIVSNHFCGKKYLNFFLTDIPLFIIGQHYQYVI